MGNKSKKQKEEKASIKTVEAEVLPKESVKDPKLNNNDQQSLTTLKETDISSVSPTDPLRQYMKEVMRHALLDPEEEVELTRRMREEGDIDAAKKLVTANLRLVVKIAFEYRSVYANTMDLIQEGNIGLMKAVSKYDPSKGAKLSYYSSWWIRSYILKYIIDNFRLVKIGTTQAQKKLFYQLVREKDRLEAQGINAGPKLLAQKLDVKEKDVVEMEQRLSSSGAEMSLDASVDGENGNENRFMSFLVDPKKSVEQELTHAELLSKLQKLLPEFAKSLSDREIKILRERVLAESPKTLQEVADEYGLTRERVRQIENKLIQKLREFAKKELAVES